MIGIYFYIDLYISIIITSFFVFILLNKPFLYIKLYIFIIIIDFTHLPRLIDIYG